MVSGVRLGDGAGGTFPDHHGVEIAKPGGGKLSVGEARAGGLDAHHRRRRPAIPAEKYQIKINATGNRWRGFYTACKLYD